MTLDEVRAVLIPVALALRADFDGPTQRAFHRVLADTPVAFVLAGVEQLIDTGLKFMPNASELLTAAEYARRRLLAAHPYEGCIECEGQRGFRTVHIEGGQSTVQVCPCKARHRARLEQMGLGTPLATVPGEAGAGDEAVYPTLSQLPERIRVRLAQVAGQKGLR